MGALMEVAEESPTGVMDEQWGVGEQGAEVQAEHQAGSDDWEDSSTLVTLAVLPLNSW